MMTSLMTSHMESYDVTSGWNKVNHTNCGENRVIHHLLFDSEYSLSTLFITQLGVIFTHLGVIFTHLGVILRH